MPDPQQDAYREAHDAATASLQRLRGVLDEMDVQIADRPPRQLVLTVEVLGDDGLLNLQRVAVVEGQTTEFEVGFHGPDGPRRSRLRVSA